MAAFIAQKTSFVLPPMIAGLLVSSTPMISVSLATQNTHPVLPHIAKAMDLTKEVGPIPHSILANSDFNLSPEAMVLRKEFGKEDS